MATLAIAFLVPVPAAAQDDAFCRSLAIAVAEAPAKFKRLRDERFDNMLESFEATLRLPGLESCWVDAISPGYFCLSRSLPAAAADELMGELVQRVHACYPHVRADRREDPKSPVPRLITQWTFDNGHQIRVVRRTYRDHPGSVFLYVR